MDNISDFGEKRLIKEFLKPQFNPKNVLGGVGDDCAMIFNNDQIWLFSTDRVPENLIAFRLGLLSYFELGKYLAYLNISDIVACGGKPEALLLNLGLPSNLLLSSFKELCNGFGYASKEFGSTVLGGDITESIELSISATAIGKVSKNEVLTRRGAKPGDVIFISKPLGISPSFFSYYLNIEKSNISLTQEEIKTLSSFFRNLRPLYNLGRKLATIGICSSCMDNTDGVGQTLIELSEASNVAFIINESLINLPQLVGKIAKNLEIDPITLAFSSGIDLSLVGTISGGISQEEADKLFNHKVKIIGYVTTGSGVLIEKSNNTIEKTNFSGWNYFSEETMKLIHS